MISWRHHMQRSLNTFIKLVNKLILKIDGDQTRPPTSYKHHNIPLVSADAVYEGGSVDEHATHAFAKTAYYEFYQDRVHQPARPD
jgi:hypothetical protein